MPDRLSSAFYASRGVADQIVSSGTNFIAALIASRCLSRTEFGLWVVGLAVAVVTASIVRGLIGDSLLVLVAKSEDVAQTLIPGAISFGIFVAGLGTAVAILLPFVSYEVFAWAPFFAPCLIGMAVQDIARYYYFSISAPGKALILDVIWLGTMLGATLVLGAVDSLNGLTLSLAWGGGGVISAVLALLLIRPSLSGPAALDWWRASRSLSRWLGPITLVGQVQNQLVLMLVAATLSPSDTGLLRAVQLIFLQPVQTLGTAAAVLFIPSLSRAVQEQQWSEVLQTALRSTAAFACLVLPLTLAGYFGSSLLFLTFGRYEESGSLVFPVAIQAMLTCLVIPWNSTVRAFRRVRALFAVQSTATVVTLVLVALASQQGGVLSVAWASAGTYALYSTAVAILALALLNSRKRKDSEVRS